jgi:hypothetical protein
MEPDFTHNFLPEQTPQAFLVPDLHPMLNLGGTGHQGLAMGHT